MEKVTREKWKRPKGNENKCTASMKSLQTPLKEEDMELERVGPRSEGEGVKRTVSGRTLGGGGPQQRH